ncbi:DUF4870 domain-containing protein [Sebaldella termitidis]|uniref:DUF4870 domain-containing protein n=1 Tax=Sebaldella termitidis TaxID=826 RepID=UPI003EB6EEAE
MENNKGNAMIIYILAIFIWFISPIIFYYIKKDGTEYERENARKSLNFEIVMTVLLFVLAILMSIVPFVWVIYLLVVLAHIVINVMAAIAANKGEETNLYIPFEIIKK